MTGIYKIVDSVNGLLWGKNILVFMLIGAALYFSFKTKFMQFRLFHKIIKVLFKNEKGRHGISSLETFFLGTACRVGAGNIAGVVAAISVGGAGSIFWMWLVAMLGSATAFIESSLAVIYRKKEKDGSYTGGTPFIIEKRLNMRWLGVIYALASVVCYFGVTQVMSNSITGSITSVYTWGADNKFFNLQNISSIAVAILVAYIIFFSKSKKDSIVESLNKIVPFMAIIYVVAVIYILVTNLTHIPAMIGNIISQAFGTREVLGGTFGAVVMNGVRRGLFSNEAGSGNSNYAAAVHIDIPAKQGMVQAFGVFIDTLVICSATAFIVLLAPESVISGLSGMGLFQAAMSYHLNGVGSLFVVILMFFFCISTILAVAFYGRSAVNFIHESKYLNIVYQTILILMIYIGGIKQDIFIWSLADFGLGIMTVINILVIIPIAKPALDSLKSYEKELK
ncbi:sodium:alanine symporter family protein [Fusobacterium nucleatum]|uniref:alanine/glycine:cation symporter family protein n=1 Tax=Fusobacterium nucleatum TaxID=851 RepID=UPI0030D0CBE1